MKQAKVAISLDRDLLDKVDGFVDNHIFKNRSQAVQIALSEIVNRIERKRLVEECKKLDASSEQDMADEGLSEDAKEWPEY